MTTAPSRLSDLVSILSRCRPPNTHALRRMHQVVARLPPSQPASVTSFSNECLHALYEDLMIVEPSTTWTSRTGADLQLPKPSKEQSDVLDSVLDTTDVASATIDALLVEYAKQGNIRDFDSFIAHTSSMSPFFSSDSCHHCIISTTDRTPTGPTYQSSYRQCIALSSFLLSSDYPTVSDECTRSVTPV
jgi:hypothetical protein